MATSKRIAYNARITLSFDYENEHISIDTMNIAYLYIDSSYVANVLPIIYLGLLVNDTLYNKIVEYKSTGSFTVDIKKFSVNKKQTTTGKSILKDHFSYLLSTNTANFMQDLNEASPNKGEDMKRQILIGLISKEMTNKLRKSFNGVYNNVSESTLVSLALEGTNPVIERLTTNKNYKSIIIPPLATRYQLLKYIFDKDPFYSTQFVMFMDFNRTYLLSQNGKKVSAEDGKPDSVLIKVNSIMSNASYFEGMSVADDHYYLDIAPTDIKILSNDSSNKMVDNVTIIDENNNISNLDIDYDNQTKGLNSKQVIVRSNNPELLKNTLESNQVRVQVVKSYIDGSVFTPNKTYNLINDKGNEQFDGLYILENKQEVFKPTVDDFQMSVVLTLRKVGKMNQAIVSKSGQLQYKKSINKAVTSSGKRSTTAALRTQANTRKVN